MSLTDNWLNKLWYTHEVQYYAVIKNDLTDMCECEKMFRISESRTAKVHNPNMPSFKLDPVLYYDLHRIFQLSSIKFIIV